MGAAGVTRWAMRRLRLPVGVWIARLDAARRAAQSQTTPVVLVRVDDYPHWSISTEQFRRFHQFMVAAGVHYLLAATPFLAANPLSPGSGPRPEDVSEWEWLACAVNRREVEIGLHGATHRTRRRGFHSEFDDMPLEEARVVVGQAWNALERRGCPPIAFVPTFDRLPPALWPALPEACKILCLGPESLRDVHPRPSVGTRNGRTVVFSLPPFYGRAKRILAALERGRWLERPGAVLPITLHWTWEVEDTFAAVAALARRIGPWTGSWQLLNRQAS